jgi:hypothetical protein
MPFWIYAAVAAAYLPCFILLAKNGERGEPLSRRLGRALLLLLFPASQLLLLAGLYPPFAPRESVPGPADLLPPLLLCLLSGLGLAATLRYVTRSMALRSRNEALQRRIGEQSAYYARLGEQDRQLRRFRHDLDNHLYTIRILLRDGKREEAADYAERLSRLQREALGEEAEP